MPKLLFIGDIVGKPGREVVLQKLAALREREEIGFVVANGENAAAGAGLTARIAQELLDAGIDAITLGDHVWDQRGFESEIDGLERVCRPANLPPQCPGRSHLILEKEGFRLGLFTLLGRTFVGKIQGECPFLCLDAKLRELREQTDAVLVEIHAEATSEKIAFGYYADGRTAAVLGTHTHVTTADEAILPRGSAYITDVGMSGPHLGVLGREMQPVIARFMDGMPRKFPVAELDARLNAVLVELSPTGGFALSIRRICERLEDADQAS